MLSAIPTLVQDKLASVLHTELRDFSFCDGGCINNGGKLITDNGNFFVKWNYAEKFPKMFSAEARGLAILHDQHIIAIPKVELTSEAGEWQFIAMEFVEQGPKSKTYWNDLGIQLASLHRVSHASFGLDHDNYIGSLRQRNTPQSDWIKFFIEQRLHPQLKFAVDNKKMNKVVVPSFESLFKKLPSILPMENPSLLHGDLWNGNLITNEKGNPCLIDPAVYFGNREIEIAFTMLFGGFSHSFYDSYNKEFPMQSGFATRINIYNLYPLLVHVNLFGGSYVSQVVSILKHYV